MKSKDQPQSLGEPQTAEKRSRGGQPFDFNPEIKKRIFDGLCKGIPLTVICQPDDMPGITTVWEWQKKDAAFGESIARAREAGFDAIAMDALKIADNTDNDTIETKFGEIPNKEWILRSKLRVETRLKLLSKWAPKLYGDKITQELTGADGGAIKTESSHRISEELQDQILQRTAEAARLASGVTPPASFRGETTE